MDFMTPPMFDILDFQNWKVKMSMYLKALGIHARFKDSAESETSRPSRIRLGPLRDESESRVGRLNSEKTRPGIGVDSVDSALW